MSDNSTDELLSELAADQQKAEKQAAEQPVQQQQQAQQQPKKGMTEKQAMDRAVNIIYLPAVFICIVIGVILCSCKVLSWWWMFAFFFGSAIFFSIILQAVIHAIFSEKK